MKKLILSLFVLSSISALAEAPQNHIYGKFGVDLYDKYSKVRDDDDPEGSSDVFSSSKGRGVGIFLEATRDVLPNTELGFGIGYIHRGNGKTETEYNTDETVGKFRDTWNTPRYKTIPLYFLAKYNFDVNSNWKPYVKVDLGYAINRKNKNLSVDYVPDVPIPTDLPETTSINIKVKNGIYAGIGIGAEYNNFLTELSYNLTTAKVRFYSEDEGKKDIWTKKYNNHAVRLSVGYKFDF